MRRIQINPRPDWQKKVEETGLVFHTAGGVPYWDESAYYEFSMAEVLEIEKATNELSRMCIEAARAVIEGNRLAELKIPETVWEPIWDAWENEPPSIYGRFDLACDGNGSIKLLEFNADTPTSLLEAAVAQWFWLQETRPRKDQFNSIHERLVKKWEELKPRLDGGTLHFGYVDDPEDVMTATYLRDTAQQAGIKTDSILMGEIGWDGGKRRFVDMNNKPIDAIFKLYPWEWLVHERFAPELIESYRSTQWIEPIWKMVLSNKGILPVLWELYPDHPNLLEAHFGDPHGMKEYARKPLLSREGANVSLRGAEGVTETAGEYGQEGFIYQKLAQLPVFDGMRPVVGSWLVDWEAAGMGIRESTGPITDNLSRFVPHLIG
ncbi:MAG: glutathionylspermidine synthase family protein [Candidatus Sumerlaeia bacterium]